MQISWNVQRFIILAPFRNGKDKLHRMLLQIWILLTLRERDRLRNINSRCVNFKEKQIETLGVFGA